MIGAAASSSNVGARINARIPSWTLDALAALARERHCTVADMVRAGLSDYVRNSGRRAVNAALLEEAVARRNRLSSRAELYEARGDRYGDPNAWEEARRLVTQLREFDSLIERMREIAGVAPGQGDD